jgi:hypothetical protein
MQSRLLSAPKKDPDKFQNFRFYFSKLPRLLFKLLFKLLFNFCCLLFQALYKLSFWFVEGTSYYRFLPLLALFRKLSINSLLSLSENKTLFLLYLLSYLCKFIQAYQMNYEFQFQSIIFRFYYC